MSNIGLNFNVQVLDLGNNKIRIGQISPGFVETEIHVGLKEDPSVPFKPEELFKFYPCLKAEDVSHLIFVKAVYKAKLFRQCCLVLTSKLLASIG